MSHNLEIQTKYEELVKRLRSYLTPELQERYDDDIILRALLAKKKDLIAAMGLLVRYTKARKDYPVLFGPASDPRMDGIFLTAMAFVPDILTPHGHHIFFVKALDWDPSRHSLEILLRSILIGAEYKSLDYAAQERGAVLLIDAQDMGWKYVWSIKPTVVHAFAQLIVYYLPLHLQNIVVYNTNWALDMIWKAIVPLIPTELAQKVVMCGSNREMLAFFVSQEAAASESFIPTQEMRLEYARDILSHDHVVQSLRTRYML